MSNAALAALVDVPRTVWGGGMRPRPLTPAVHPYIEVHHSAATGHYDRDPLVVALEIERYHLGLDWNGAFYGLLIATDGRVIELRGVGWRSIGAYRARYDDDTPVNPAALCVLLPGNYVTQHPTDAQLATLDRLRAAVPDPRLRWHGMRDNTACCGTHAIQMCQELNAHPPTVEDDDMAVTTAVGRDRQGCWWRAKSTGDTCVEISESDARTLLYIDPNASEVTADQIEFLKRVNVVARGGA